MNRRIALGLVLVIIGLSGAVTSISLYSTGFYGNRYWTTSLSTLVYRYRPSLPLTMEQAASMVKLYLDSLNNPDLAIKEIMEFEQNFYIIFYEKSTGIGAFEMLIWKTNPSYMMGSMMVGQIMPEPGPNMMWNTKYGGKMGHMGSGMMGGEMMVSRYRGVPTADMPIDEDEAKEIGQQYLDIYFPTAAIMESTKFYGYYTFDFGKGDGIYWYVQRKRPHRPNLVSWMAWIIY
ncbi:MAG: hypothetical protein QW265_00460 [Candidatus Bathyarchaeia archaeon]